MPPPLWTVPWFTAVSSLFVSELRIAFCLDSSEAMWFLELSRWSASSLMPCSVCCCSCCTDDNWVASARNAWVSRFLVPMICVTSDDSASTWLGLLEVSRPARDVAAESSYVESAISTTSFRAVWYCASSRASCLSTCFSCVLAAVSCSSTWSYCWFALLNSPLRVLIVARTWSMFGWGSAPATCVTTTASPAASRTAVPGTAARRVLPIRPPKHVRSVTLMSSHHAHSSTTLPRY